jgi:amino acid transporter
VFNPGNAPTVQGIYIGATFSVFAFSGWETTTPLAEETRDPRKAVPIALVSSVLLVGSVDLVVSWGAVLGLGPRNVASAAGGERNPLFALADRVWGFGWAFLLFALLNSAFCTALGGLNATVRMWYAMGRTGALPTWLGHIHPRWRTPN